jgi:hypothetical protein
MMTLEQAQTATLDQLTDELAAAGWDSTQQTRAEAYDAVVALIRETNGTQYRFENGKLYKLNGNSYIHCFSSIYATDEETAIAMYEASQE